MPRLIINGNASPQIGIQNEYSLSILGILPSLSDNPLFGDPKIQTEWNMHV